MYRAIFLCALLFSPLFLQADAHWYIEAKPGYYYFTNDTTREVLGDGAFSIRGETGCQFYGPLTLWVDGGYLSKKGIAVNGDNTCKLTMGDVAAGAKAIFFLKPTFALYVGAGPRMFFIQIDNSSSFIKRHIHTSKLGGAFSAGAWFLPLNHLFFDVFLDYSYVKFTPSKNNLSTFIYPINLSGLAAGLGVGVRF